MMNEGDVLRIKRDVCVVYVLRSKMYFMMSDAIVFFYNWLATIFADDITIGVDTFGFYFAKKILPGF